MVALPHSLSPTSLRQPLPRQVLLLGLRLPAMNMNATAQMVTTTQVGCGKSPDGTTDKAKIENLHRILGRKRIEIKQLKKQLAAAREATFVSGDAQQVRDAVRKACDKK